MMSPRWRKALLVAHVTTAVGWLGAVAAFLAVAVTAATTDDAGLATACVLVMELLGWAVLVPLSGASLVTGVIQSLATPWGLFRHYWVVFKLLINVVASVILVMYMQTLAALAGSAAGSAGTTAPDVVAAGQHGMPQAFSPVLHAGGALVLLLLAVLLSVYKPKGLTRYGQRAARGTGEPAVGRP